MTQLTRLSLANRLIVGLATIAIVIFGVLAAASLRQELLPSTQVPTAILTATYPGTAPELVADEVATPLEQAISGVSGVTRVRSVSTNGVASLTVEWTYGLDNDEVVGDIRSAADGVAQRLPDVVEYEVLAGSTDDIPVLVLGVASDAPLGELARQVENTVVPQLSRDRRRTPGPGVRAGHHRAGGHPAARATAEVRPERGGGHPGRPGPGRRWYRPATATTAAPSWPSRWGSPRPRPSRSAGWWIPAPDGPVRLGTLAAVEVRSVEATTIARSDGRPALSVNVLKESDADAVEISHLITERLPGLAEDAGPERDDPGRLRPGAARSSSRSRTWPSRAASASAFAVLIILVFLLSVRSTIIIAISIPLSLLIALIGLQLGDYSLNIFTLAAMTVAVGRVVDDSIVVIENIKRRDTGTAAADPGRHRGLGHARWPARSPPPPLTTVAVFAAGGRGVGDHRRAVPAVLDHGGPRPGRFAAGVDDHRAGAGVLVPACRGGLPGGQAASAAARIPRPRPGPRCRLRDRRHDEDQVTRLQRGYLPVLGLVLRRPLISALAAVVIFAGTLASTTFLKTDFLESFADKTHPAHRPGAAASAPGSAPPARRRSRWSRCWRPAPGSRST